MSEKIKPLRLERKALLYVRQSSTRQVIHHRESRSLQYAMRERLVELSWPEIEIIDDDLGISAAANAARAGFERMVAEVCLGKVGGWRRVRSRASHATAAKRLPFIARLPFQATNSTSFRRNFAAAFQKLTHARPKDSSLGYLSAIL